MFVCDVNCARFDGGIHILCVMLTVHVSSVIHILCVTLTVHVLLVL